MSFLYYAKRLFVVHKCVSCRQILKETEYDSAFCSKCRKQYDKVKVEGCPDCYKAVCECGCQPKLLSKSGSLCLRKLYFYSAEHQGQAQNLIIYFIKHNKNKRASEFLAKELLKLVEEECSDLGLDLQKDFVLQNVPRGIKSLYKYGFDQSAELCRAMSRFSGIPYLELLFRRAGGKEQKKLTAKERKKNIEKLIALKKGSTELVKEKYVVLVDDVVTTGASMACCAEILRKSGAKGIISVCVATNVKNKG